METNKQEQMEESYPLVNDIVACENALVDFERCYDMERKRDQITA